MPDGYNLDLAVLYDNSNVTIIEMIRIYKYGSPEELNEEMSLIERYHKKGLLKLIREYDTLISVGICDGMNIYEITDSSFPKNHKLGMPIYVSVDNKKPRILEYRERLYVMKSIYSQQ